MFVTGFTVLGRLVATATPLPLFHPQTKKARFISWMMRISSPIYFWFLYCYHTPAPIPFQ